MGGTCWWSTCRNDALFKAVLNRHSGLSLRVTGEIAVCSSIARIVLFDWPMAGAESGVFQLSTSFFGGWKYRSFPWLPSSYYHRVEGLFVRLQGLVIILGGNAFHVPLYSSIYLSLHAAYLPLGRTTRSQKRGRTGTSPSQPPRGQQGERCIAPRPGESIHC